MAREVKYSISADSSKYERAMSRVKKTTMSAEAGINKAFKAAGVAGAAAIAAFGLMAKQTLKAGDNIHKLSQRLGFTTEFLSQMQHAANLSGTSIETFATATRRMERRVSDANLGLGTAVQSMKDLGLDINKVTAMNPEQQFYAFAKAIGEVKNQSDKLRIAADVFGGRGVEMLQIIYNGTEGLDEMRKEADRLGLTLSQEGANKIADFNDEMVRFKGAIMGVVQATVVALVPELTIMVDFFGNKIPKAIEIAIKPLKIWAEIWQTLGWIASGQRGRMPELPAPVVAPEAQKKSPLGISGEVMNGELALLVEKEEQKFQIAMESQTRMEEMLGSSYVVMNEMDNTRAQQEIALATGLEAEIVSLKQRSTQSQISIARSLFTAGLQIAGVEGKKMFVIQKMIDMGMALSATYRAYTLALAIPPAPNYPLAGAALKAGMWGVGAIAATTIGQITAPSGATGGGTYVSPTVTIPAVEPIPAGTQPAGPAIEVHIHGDYVDSEEHRRNLAEYLTDWVENKGGYLVASNAKYAEAIE